MGFSMTPDGEPSIVMPALQSFKEPPRRWYPFEYCIPPWASCPCPRAAEAVTGFGHPPLILSVLNTVEVSGICHVAVKCLDMT